MATFVQETLSIGQDDFVSSATQVHPLGTRAVSKDGRSFRYVKAGVADLVAGNCLQSPAIIALHLTCVPPIVPIGAKSFTFTPGSTAGAANYYENGLMQVDTTPGEGYTYSVAGHAAFNSGTAFTLNLNDPIQVALTASSSVGLIANPYRGVIQMPITTATASLVGVAHYVITGGQFGWITTWGLTSVLIGGTPALGACVMSPGTVAGNAVVMTTTNLIVAQVVGNMAQIGVNTELNFVFVRISP
jgi:hypothetical protein